MFDYIRYVLVLYHYLSCIRYYITTHECVSFRLFVIIMNQMTMTRGICISNCILFIYYCILVRTFDRTVRFLVSIAILRDVA